MELCNINMDRLILLKNYERSERGEIVELARNISRNGLLVPLTVKKILHTDRYEVISGIKRFYACRMARIKNVPAIVIDMPSLLARVTIKKTEKQDVFNEAEALRDAILNEGMSAEELSDATGYSEKQILCLLRLTKLGDFEREIVRRNGVSTDIASEIAKIDDICKRTELLSRAVNSRLKASEVKSLCEHSDRLKAERSAKFKDLKLFDNTLSRAIALLSDAGVNAKICSEKVNNATEYKIRIET